MSSVSLSGFFGFDDFDDFDGFDGFDFLERVMASLVMENFEAIKRREN